MIILSLKLLVVDLYTFSEHPSQDEEKTSDKDHSTNQMGNPSDTFPKTPKEISKRANPSIEENRLFEEMMKCDKLQDDITSANNIQSSVGPKGKE